MALTEKLKAIADAIRGKTGKAEEMTLDQMPTEIEVIQSGGGGNSEEITIYANDATNMFRMMAGRTPPDFPKKMVINFPIFGYGGVYGNITEMFRNNEIIEDVEIHSGHRLAENTQVAYAFAGCSKLRRVVLTSAGNAQPMFWRWTFQNCPELEEVQLKDIDFTKCALYGWNFENCPKLVTVVLKPSSIVKSETFNESSLLSTESLVNIANALSSSASAQTLTLHATAQENCTAIMGNNSDGTFVQDDSGAMTLTEFITTVKGWTIA